MSTGTITFPKFGSDIKGLYGTVTLPYRSIPNDHTKSICFTCPISFNLKFKNYGSPSQAITIIIDPGSYCNVYLNDVFLKTIYVKSTSSQLNKTYIMNNPSSQTTFEINDYFTNIEGIFYPDENQTPASTQVYKFEAVMTYTITSTSNQIVYFLNDGLTCGFVFNTTQQSSYLLNFSYNGSSSTYGYNQYKMFTELSTPRQATWLISALTSGNGQTPSGSILGSQDNFGARFDKVDVMGNAFATNWNSNTGIFTANVSGIYSFQLFIFNNSTTTSGRFLSARGMCVPYGTQYLTFNQSYLTGNSGSVAVSLMYYMIPTQTLYFYCETGSPTLYYGDSHTCLQIIKIA
jgi:hypothetical protein